MDVAFALFLSFLAGISTTIGGMISFFLRKSKFCYLCIAFGFSAGVMIFISFTELLRHAIEMTSLTTATIGFFAGILIIYVIDSLVPHIYKEEHHGRKRRNSVKGSVKRTALLMFLGITIHNFPEGMVVVFSTLSNTGLGILVAIAVALHNIPEGIAVSMPIYYATRDKKKAFFYAFLSGIAEPIGAVLSVLFLAQFLTPMILAVMLSAVAGVMVFISFDELLPYVYKQRGAHDQHLAMLGLFMGMFVIALTILFV